MVRPVVALRRVVGPLLPKMEGRNEQSSPVCSTKGSGPIVQRALAAEPRGAREAVGRHRLPRGSRSAGGPAAANTMSVDAKDAGIDTHCACRQLECAGESRLRGSRASLNSNCQKTGESNHLQRRFILHGTSSSTLSNSTNESVTWQAAKFGRRREILELAHPPVT